MNSDADRRLDYKAVTLAYYTNIADKKNTSEAMLPLPEATGEYGRPLS